MQDYSLDLASERIKHPKTKEYFREVMSSYAIGNFRSAVLSLYAVVISDLVFKLKDQVERENDPGAMRILQEVEADKKRDVTSSRWEMMLVDKISQETKLLELSDKANIEYLKDHRNLSAHPNILDTEDNVLFTPNKETVRAHIRNMLEGVLTKSSAHTAKLVDLIITKLPQIYDLADDESEYDRMFMKRYLGEMNEKAVVSLFKKLWKFTYRLDDKDCEDNRDVNARTIELINRMYPDLVIKCLTDDPAYYSQVSLDKEQLNKIIDLFNQSPRLFTLLDEDVQKQMDAEIKRNSSRYVRSWFLSGSPEDHLISATQYLRSRNFSNISLHKFGELARQVNKMDDYRKMLIKYFSNAGSYQDGYMRFDHVRRKLDDFNEEQFKELLNVMNSNKQIYNANGCSGMVDDIQEAAENNLGGKIDLSPYPNLR
ncbi:hypothetical protein [Paenibacillus hexagrammi]|uniref:Uncharacterized protein n=1 Tax=Paenibacillus hexagrammi TaxID=2908839 RepID=A0ABY3SFG5_9BACL|nr:hypothetical protein [Paenibacillus sp. YPD9-1]UJF32180.1 hypothetical protein L0M14_20970 [Paenibacillus sp. YPD9-1]